MFHEQQRHLRSEEEFVERWRKQLAEGYGVVYVPEDGTDAAADGYRFLNTWREATSFTSMISSHSGLSIAPGSAHFYYSICRQKLDVRAVPLLTSALDYATWLIVRTCATAPISSATTWCGRSITVDHLGENDGMA